MPKKLATGLSSFPGLVKRGEALAGRPRAEESSAIEEPAKRGRTKGGKAQLLVYLQPGGIRELKIAAIDRGTSASAIVAEALNEWFQRNGRPPVA